MTGTDARALRQHRLAMPAVGRFVVGVLRAIAREHRLRRQVAYLLDQDQRMLADLGLTQHDVVRFVRYGRGL